MISMKKYLKFIFLMLESFVIFVVMWATIVSLVKHIEKNVLVNSFKSGAVLNQELSTAKIKMYEVKGNEELPSYVKYNNKIVPGNKADIILACDSLMDVSDNGFINSFVKSVITFYAGGHASLVVDEYRNFEYSTTSGDYVPGFTASDINQVESTGIGYGLAPAILSDRSYEWQDRQEVIVMRAKITEEERNEVISMATSFVDEPYNYSFLFDIDNTSYCSDLVAKCYKKVGIELNKDSFATTIYDIITSSDVYMSYYHYFDSNGVKHIYYLT